MKSTKKTSQIITVTPDGKGWWAYTVHVNGRLVLAGAQAGTRAETLREAHYRASHELSPHKEAATHG